MDGGINQLRLHSQPEKLLQGQAAQGRKELFDEPGIVQSQAPVRSRASMVVPRNRDNAASEEMGVGKARSAIVTGRLHLLQVGVNLALQIFDTPK